MRFTKLEFWKWPSVLPRFQSQYISVFQRFANNTLKYMTMGASILPVNLGTIDSQWSETFHAAKIPIQPPIIQYTFINVSYNCILQWHFRKAANVHPLAIGTIKGYLFRFLLQYGYWRYQSDDIMYLNGKIQYTHAALSGDNLPIFCCLRHSQHIHTYVTYSYTSYTSCC